jgi:hypothetical protein
MSDPAEQIQLRQHLSEMRRAAHGIGKDFDLWFQTIDEKIAKASTRAGRDVRDDWRDIEDDMTRLGRALDHEISNLPRHLKEGAVNVASRVGSGGVWVAETTRDALGAAKDRAAEGTKNALAKAAGVNRKPMKEWHHSTVESETEER